jgi:hypothetical protein
MDCLRSDSQRVPRRNTQSHCMMPFFISLGGFRVQRLTVTVSNMRIAVNAHPASYAGWLEFSRQGGKLRPATDGLGPTGYIQSTIINNQWSVYGDGWVGSGRWRCIYLKAHLKNRLLRIFKWALVYSNWCEEP